MKLCSCSFPDSLAVSCAVFLWGPLGWGVAFPLVFKDPHGGSLYVDEGKKGGEGGEGERGRLSVCRVRERWRGRGDVGGEVVY